MPATRAEAAARLRRTLQDRPILAAFAFDRVRKTPARAFAQGLREGMRVRLGEGAFELDRWPADQPRAQGWEQEWSRRLTEAAAVLVIGLSRGWAERALDLAQRERRRRPTLPVLLLLLLPERAAPPPLDPAPTAVITVRAFDRLAAARLEAPLVEAIRRSVTVTPEQSTDPDQIGASSRAPGGQAPLLARRRGGSGWRRWQRSLQLRERAGVLGLYPRDGGGVGACPRLAIVAHVGLEQPPTRHGGERNPLDGRTLAHADRTLLQPARGGRVKTDLKPPLSNLQVPLDAVDRHRKRLPLEPSSRHWEEPVATSARRRCSSLSLVLAPPQ
jgi:hypothetical protein